MSGDPEQYADPIFGSVDFHQGDESWHDGPGWYYVDREYPDEGSVGAFETFVAAVDHAVDVYFDELSPPDPAKGDE